MSMSLNRIMFELSSDNELNNVDVVVQAGPCWVCRKGGGPTGTPGGGSMEYPPGRRGFGGFPRKKINT
ncbi:hypothetical protein J6590_074264 [Homalodisca vitripennis]|nr:hypothetical protein J6590_074264 [Homalodisca vitripennis]